MVSKTRLAELIQQFNEFLAIKVTNAVGTMWCAYLFTGLALTSRPWELHGNQLISWITQTFLQLVLLSILQVGTTMMSKKHDETSAKLDNLQDKHDELHAAITNLTDKTREATADDPSGN